MRRIPCLLASLLFFLPLLPAQQPGRERLNMDKGWRFAQGHATETEKDFDYGTVPFFFGKAGYGDGPTAARFDERAWQKVDLPRDWVISLPFDPETNGNHGSHAVGLLFPENNIGWYRRSFFVPAGDKGRRIWVVFDGVYRDSVVWLNGHYLGEEHSGYSQFRYDLSDYLNYGGSNTLVVRASTAVEEGWFYEGGGIYRNVWLEKFDPLHVAANGTFVSSDFDAEKATVKIQTRVDNDGEQRANFVLAQTILDAEGKELAHATGQPLNLDVAANGEFTETLTLPKPHLWSLEDPYRYTLVTTILRGGETVDRYETRFGIRSAVFDPQKGFFLNGKRVQIQGTNYHQDAAGVGNAVPESLAEYRIKVLKSFGSNAIRAGHHPLAPEVLEACDRLGMLVLEEHRMMGTTPELLGQLRRMIERDRNRPSIVLWSVGNEEWALEWSETGARINQVMQRFVNRLDPTRRVTAGMSGSGFGVSLTSQMFGFNYLTQHDFDAMHGKYPERPAVGTEESATTTTRGIYADDKEHQHLAAYDRKANPRASSIEEALQFYAARPWMSGYFVWTGFDYRGEPTPFGWPATLSQYGVVDLCGFYKDNAYLLKAWWQNEPMIHILPHWNCPGREGKPVDVRVYSNAQEVELLLNGQSLGRKTMPVRSHLAWQVPYQPGRLEARGYTAGNLVASEVVETTGAPSAILLTPATTELAADNSAVAVVNVRIGDAAGRTVPVAENLVRFTLKGVGKIIGVANGDPASHEPDVYVEHDQGIWLTGWKQHKLASAGNLQGETATVFDDAKWESPFEVWDDHNDYDKMKAPSAVYRAAVELPALDERAQLTLLFNTVGDRQSIYLNGRLFARDLAYKAEGYELPIERSLLHKGKNSVAVVATPMKETKALQNAFGWGGKGLGQIRVTLPPEQWRRKAFNGLAQVIVQATETPGEIELTAEGEGLQPATLHLSSHAVPPQPSVP
jgi:beta-galactosidase